MAAGEPLTATRTGSFPGAIERNRGVAQGIDGRTDGCLLRCASHLARALSDLGEQFKRFILVFTFRRQRVDKSFNPSAIGSKVVDVFRGQIL